jgi:hypothetical protein
MSNHITPFIQTITNELQALRQALRTVCSDLDDVQFATVMGNRLSKAGLRAPTDLQAQVHAEPALSVDSIGSGDMADTRKAVRKLMDDYAVAASNTVFQETTEEYHQVHTKPALLHASNALAMFANIDQSLADLQAAANRVPGAGGMSVKRKEAIARHAQTDDKVKVVANRTSQQVQSIVSLTEAINSLLYGGGAADPDLLEDKQKMRDATDKERK